MLTNITKPSTPHTGNETPFAIIPPAHVGLGVGVCVPCGRRASNPPGLSGSIVMTVYLWVTRLASSPGEGHMGNVGLQFFMREGRSSTSTHDATSLASVGNTCEHICVELGVLNAAVGPHHLKARPRLPPPGRPPSVVRRRTPQVLHGWRRLELLHGRFADGHNWMHTTSPSRAAIPALNR